MAKPLEEMTLDELKMAYAAYLVEADRPFTYEPDYHRDHRLFLIKELIELHTVRDLKSAYRTYLLVNGV